MIRVRFSEVGRDKRTFTCEYEKFDADLLAESVCDLAGLMTIEKGFDADIVQSKDNPSIGFIVVGVELGAPRVVGKWEIVGSSD